MEHTEHICTILDNLHKRLSHLESLSVNYMKDTRENRKYFHNIDMNDPLKRFVALNQGNDESMPWIITYFDGKYAVVKGNKMWSNRDKIYKTAQITLTVKRFSREPRNLYIHGDYRDKNMIAKKIDMQVEHVLLSQYITDFIYENVYQVEST